MACIAEGFQSLTNVAIYKGTTKLASISTDVTNNDFNIDLVSRNLTEGELVIKLPNIQCSDGGTYSCHSTGTGRFKRNDLKLNMVSSEDSEFGSLQI